MDVNVIKYRLIHNSLKTKIFKGELRFGCKIPSERKLMAEYNVSRQTIREALANLESEGLLIRQQGRGNIVGLSSQNSPCHSTQAREIGLITAGLDDSYTLPLLKAVEKGATQAGYSTIIANNPNGLDTNMKNVLDMLNRHVAGFIIFPLITHEQNKTYRFLRETGVPFVFVDGLVQCVEADCITTDNFSGAYEGTRVLLAAGCRQLAYIGISMATWTTRERLSGFQKAIWDAGLEVNRNLLYEGYFERPYIEETLKKIQLAQPAVDGIFFGNHPLTEMAFEIIEQTSRTNRMKMLFGSFDAPLVPDTLKGKVVSVCQSGAEIGANAVNILLERISEQKKDLPPVSYRHIQIPPTIIRK